MSECEYLAPSHIVVSCNIFEKLPRGEGAVRRHVLSSVHIHKHIKLSKLSLHLVSIIDYLLGSFRLHLHM